MYSIPRNAPVGNQSSLFKLATNSLPKQEISLILECLKSYYYVRKYSYVLGIRNTLPTCGTPGRLQVPCDIGWVYW